MDIKLSSLCHFPYAEVNIKVSEVCCGSFKNAILHSGHFID